MRKLINSILAVLSTMAIVVACEKEPKTISVTGIALDKSSVELVEGESASLTATITPSNATNTNVSWTSSDESVASVDQTGKVTALNLGTATITVTTEDGKKTAQCKLTVTGVSSGNPFGGNTEEDR